MKSRRDKSKENSRITAEACNGAMALLAEGYIERENLYDLTVRDAREIIVRGNANMRRLEALGEQAEAELGRRFNAFQTTKIA